MGGRGASSGTSVHGNKYGSQYRSVLKVGNIKFLEAKTKAQPETLMETMTKGRVYAVVKNGKIASIVYFDSNNKRSKQIDLSHRHNKEVPHTHHGYYHNENDTSKGYSRLTTKERKMVERVLKAWENR